MPISLQTTSKILTPFLFVAAVGCGGVEQAAPVEGGVDNIIVDVNGNITLEDNDNNASVTVVAGKTLTVRLRNPITSGYSAWAVSNMGSLPAPSTYDEPGSGALGDGGKNVFVWNTANVTPGTYNVQLSSSRPFGNNPPIGFYFTLTVQAAAPVQVPSVAGHTYEWSGDCNLGIIVTTCTMKYQFRSDGFVDTIHSPPPSDTDPNSAFQTVAYVQNGDQVTLTWTSSFGNSLDPYTLSADGSSLASQYRTFARTSVSGVCTLESEPNTSSSPNALGAAACGALTAQDQDWFTWSVSTAGVPYVLKLNAAGDAQLSMWKNQNGTWQQIQATGANEFRKVSTGSGTYLVSVWSPSGAAQGYEVTLTR